MMTTKLRYVTDDRLSLDAGIELGIKIGLIERTQDDKLICCQHDVDNTIKYGIENGFFKLHFELGEPYYHATSKGLESLNSKGKSL